MWFLEREQPRNPLGDYGGRRLVLLLITFFVVGLRFLLIARAGRVARIGGRQVLRLSWNPATEAVYERVTHALVA